MGIPGRPPKDDSERVRRNAPIYDKVQLRWDGLVRGPDLPERWGTCPCRGAQNGPHPGFFGVCNKYVEIPWHPQTHAWYEEWRRTPQSMTFTDTDWAFFADTALLFDRYWSEDAKTAEMVALAGEIRRRLDAYGGTFEARRKLRMEIQSDAHDAGKEAQVSNDAKEAVDYAEMLAKEAARLKEG